MSKSLKKGNDKIAELKAKYNEIAFELTMPMALGQTFEKFAYADPEMEQFEKEFNMNSKDSYEGPTKESNPSSIRKSDERGISTNSRSNEKSDFMEKDLTRFVDSKQRKPKRGKKKKAPVVFSPSVFNENDNHSIKY